MICNAGPQDRRRGFWTTQPNACGTVVDCAGDECGQSGLVLKSEGGFATFATGDYVRGLALNMLLTNGRKPDTPCGYTPGDRGGHWSDSFRRDGQSCGTLLRTLPTVGSLRDSVRMVKAFAQVTLERLVTMGVASRVEVEVEYIGGTSVNMRVTIYGQGSEVTTVGVTGERLDNGWVWNQ